jgi:hypothetical protein
VFKPGGLQHTQKVGSVDMNEYDLFFVTLLRYSGRQICSRQCRSNRILHHDWFRLFQIIKIKKGAGKHTLNLNMLEM